MGFAARVFLLPLLLCVAEFCFDGQRVTKMLVVLPSVEPRISARIRIISILVHKGVAYGFALSRQELSEENLNLPLEKGLTIIPVFYVGLSGCRPLF